MCGPGFEYSNPMEIMYIYVCITVCFYKIYFVIIFQNTFVKKCFMINNSPRSL